MCTVALPILCLTIQSCLSGVQILCSHHSVVIMIICMKSDEVSAFLNVFALKHCSQHILSDADS